MLNKITKKYAMEQLKNNKVQFVGSYMGLESKNINCYLVNNYDSQVMPYLKNTEIRKCIKQSCNQIIFERPNGEKTYLKQITNSKWYETIIKDKQFIIIEGKDGFTTCYHIIKGE